MTRKEIQKLREELPAIKADKSCLNNSSLFGLGRKALGKICLAYHIRPRRSNWDTANAILSSVNLALEIRLVPSIGALLGDESCEISEMIGTKILKKSPWTKLLKPGKWPDNLNDFPRKGRKAK